MPVARVRLPLGTPWTGLFWAGSVSGEGRYPGCYPASAQWLSDGWAKTADEPAPPTPVLDRPFALGTAPRC